MEVQCSWSVSFAPLLRTISTVPCCEIRALVMHLYPDGIKDYHHDHLTVYVSRRGKPVLERRYLPMARALDLARKLQRRTCTTVMVI